MPYSKGMWSWFFLTSLSAFLRLSGASEYKGCFADNPAIRDLPLQITTPGANTNVERCTDECTRQYFMYAGLQEGKFCYCGSAFGQFGVSNCTIRCEGNSTQFCGGFNANSVYTTNFMVPGPPQNVTLTTAKENSLVVHWLPPRAKNGIILQYKVDAKLIFTHLGSASTVNPHLNWAFSNTTYEAELSGLMPGTQYNISVRASSSLGDGILISALFWTDISEPEVPRMAEIIRKDGSQMTIKIPEVTASKGPISAYRVVVYDDSQNFPLDPNRLTSYEEAKQNKWPFYIAAELLPQQAMTNFVVGDGGRYNGFFNAPLEEDKLHTVVIGVVSRLNGISKAAYSPPATFQIKPGAGGESVVDKVKPDSAIPVTPPMHEDPGYIDSHEHQLQMNPEGHAYVDSSIVTGLGVAVGVAAALLVASIVIYFLIRRHYGQRQQPDHQELTLQSPSPDVTENGITSSILVMEDEGDLDFLYDSLKDKFWQIPRPHLDISDEILGQGKFGAVYKGVAHRRNQQFSVSIQITQAHITDNEREKRAFLNDLDVLIRVGSHSNVVGLVGGCEERDLFHVCTEWYPGTLKDFLLDSRTMEHYPVYAEKQQLISTLKSLQLLELALGIARGMAHLSNNKITHKRLMARNIVVVDDVTAKITDFGLLQLEGSSSFDITRWLSMETLKSRLFTSKSDVWMFGVVLWEIVTLGATPYSDVKAKDIPTRVLRGSRLHQPKNVGDDLYQIMLQCWQVDLDERPSFQELTSILGTIVTEGADYEHLHLQIFPGFQYEKYEKDYELVSALQ